MDDVLTPLPEGESLGIFNAILRERSTPKPKPPRKRKPSQAKAKK